MLHKIYYSFSIEREREIIVIADIASINRFFGRKANREMWAKALEGIAKELGFIDIVVTEGGTTESFLFANESNVINFAAETSARAHTLSIEMMVSAPLQGIYKSKIRICFNVQATWGKQEFYVFIPFDGILEELKSPASIMSHEQCKREIQNAFRNAHECMIDDESWLSKHVMKEVSNAIASFKERLEELQVLQDAALEKGRPNIQLVSMLARPNYRDCIMASNKYYKAHGCTKDKSRFQ